MHNEEEKYENEMHPADQLEQDVNEEIEEPAPQQEEQKDSPHFARLREKAERLEQENRQYQERLSQLEQYAAQYSQNATYATKKRQDEPTYEPIGDDDIVEGRHFTRLEKRIMALQNNLDAKEKEKAEQKRVQEEYNRVKSRHMDYEQVVSKENVERLWREHPQMAKSLRASLVYEGDIEGAAQATYDLIRSLGYNKSPEIQQAKRRAESNMEAPMPPSPQSPLNSASSWENGLMSDSEKESLIREMEEARMRR